MTKIKNEYIKCKKSKSLALNTISVGKITDYEWIASFIGPKKAGYKGGLFKLIIKILENYPDIPEICFKSPIKALPKPNDVSLKLLVNLDNPFW